MATPHAPQKRKTAAQPLGRRSTFRSKKPKVVRSFSLTPECSAQVDALVKRGTTNGANVSVWFEDIVWKLSRRKRPL
jgi:hypothetical protein